MYNYNFDLECTYNKYNIPEECDDNYRKELLEAFYLQHTINDNNDAEVFIKLSENVEQIGSIIFKDEKMKDYAIRLANRIMSNDPNLGILFFFSYDLFWIIHKALKKLYNGHELDNSIYKTIEDILSNIT